MAKSTGAMREIDCRLCCTDSGPPCLDECPSSGSPRHCRMKTFTPHQLRDWYWRCGPGTRHTQEYLETDKGDITYPSLQVTPALQVIHLQPETGRKKYSACPSSRLRNQFHLTSKAACPRWAVMSMQLLLVTENTSHQKGPFFSSTSLGVQLWLCHKLMYKVWTGWFFFITTSAIIVVHN